MKALRTYDACIACLTRENLDAEWIHFEVGAIAIRDHFHILLEVPPMPEGGISDEELLNRLSATNSEAFVALVAKELTEARGPLSCGPTRVSSDLRSVMVLSPDPGLWCQREEKKAPAARLSFRRK